MALIILAAAASNGGSPSAPCNLEGNWGGIGYSDSLFQVVQLSTSLHDFTVYYSGAPQGIAGTVVSTTVSIPGWVGQTTTSPYRNFNTNASGAPPCSLLNFNQSKALWCKYPYCPFPQPPAPPTPAPVLQVPLTLLPQDAGNESPATLDGSPYGFYHQPSQSGKSTKWTISIEGGGWCYNEEDCWSRSKSALGTSKLWPATMPFSMDPFGMHFRAWEMGCMNAIDGTLDMDCNAIYLPYGDGASFAGYREAPWAVPGTNGTNKLWFRGIKNLDATLEWALQHGLGRATELVVTGVSAGGLSSFLHVDRIAARVREVNPSIKVRGAPVVGFFLDHPNFVNNAATSYTAEMAYLYNMQNLTFGSDGGVMQGCAAAYPAEQQHLCVMSPHMAKFVQTPYFVFNSRFDAWQLGNILQVGSWTGDKAKQDALVQYGADFLTEFEAVVPVASNGAFISTCICHACPFPTLTLENKTAFQHYAAWYEGVTAGGQASVHVDARPPNGGGAIVDSLCAAFP